MYLDKIINDKMENLLENRGNRFDFVTLMVDTFVRYLHQRREDRL